MRFFLALLFLFFISPMARAEIDVPRRFFEDPTASLTIKDIIALPVSTKWQPVTKSKTQFGSTHSRVWLRFFLPRMEVSDEGRTEVLLLEIPHAYLQKVDLYAVNGGKVIRHSSTGVSIPVSQRDRGVLPAAPFVFRILPPYNHQTEYFLSAQSDLPLSIPFRMWQAKDFTYHQWTKTFFLGIFFGGLAIAAGFNGFIAISLRSRLYLFYSLFVANISMLFLAHEGFSIQFLWPESPRWARREFFFFGAGAVIFYASFVREFLESRKIAPGLDILLRLLIGAALFSTVAVLIEIRQPFVSLSQVFVVILNLLALALAAKALWQRKRAAMYFLISSLAFNISMIFYQLQEANLIWIGSFVSFAPHVSIALEVLLLSFALADRIRQVNRELVRQKAAVVYSEKMSALGRLAGEISHEINNPLAIIHGNAALIEKSEASPQVKEFASIIEQTAKRISKIVKGMRSLSRDSRKDPLLPASLSTLIQDTISLFSERVKAENIRLEIVKPESDIIVLARGSEICQVLLNLVSNAFDAIEGTRDAWVKIEAKASQKMAEICVSDNGSGVPEGLRNLILEPFFTTKEPGKGLGLGLSISRSIVEAHGGKLRLDDSATFTRFVFTIPLVPPESLD